MGSRKEVVAEAPFSLECSMQSADLGNTGLDHGAGSMSFSIWSEPFNLGNEIPSVCAELRRRAPFLQGSDRAQYTEDFFKEIGGLCGVGIPFKKLKEEHGVSFESLLSMYPCNRSHNRHPTRHMSESVAAHALRMYQRVYGGTQPDNGEFGTAFLRGLQLQAKKEKVNWAKGAAELVEVRVKNGVSNPGKLTPPCLREQIQSMLDLMMGLLSHAVAANSTALVELKQDQIPVCLAAHMSIDKKVIAKAPKQSGKAVADQIVFTDVPIEIRALIKQPRGNNKPKSFLQEDAKASVGSLLKRRASMEEMLAESLHQKKIAEAKLGQLQQQKKDVEREEEGHWDNFATIQQSKKDREMDKLERDAVDSQLRAAMAAASASTDALEANASEVDKWSRRMENLTHQSIKLRDIVVELTGQIHVVLIEESCIRPQQFFTSFPKEAVQMVPLKTELPCVLCGYYWAEMALVNLPCGCLLHPCCMFKIALCDAPKCPGCNHTPGGVWMGQWGFVTNHTSMEASIAAFGTTMDGDGWAPPIKRAKAISKVTEMLSGLEAVEQGEWSVLKRAIIPKNSAIEIAHLPKRVCVGQRSPFCDIGSPTVHALTSKQGSMIGPSILQDPVPLISNQHLDQHLSSEKDTSIVGETPSLITHYNSNLGQLDVGADYGMELVAIAHAAAAESLALNGGFEVDVL